MNTPRTFHESVSERIRTDDMNGEIVPGHIWALRQRNKPRKLTPAMLEQFRRDLHQAILDATWTLHPQFYGIMRADTGRRKLAEISDNLDALLDLCAGSPSAHVREAASDWLRQWDGIIRAHWNFREKAKYGRVPDQEVTQWFNTSKALPDQIISLAAYASWEGGTL